MTRTCAIPVTDMATPWPVLTLMVPTEMVIVFRDSLQYRVRYSTVQSAVHRHQDQGAVVGKYGVSEKGVLIFMG